DPAARLSMAEPFHVTEVGDDVIMPLAIPFAEKGEVDVIRVGDEIVVTVGPYRRAFILPDSLKRREVNGAKLSEGVLAVTFT
ncbi:MAG: ArsA family ATPase, partial [Acidimicrobiia bacterium]|nr:ArsA family ATPase [Acidimicrobiia bacterium]